MQERKPPQLEDLKIDLWCVKILELAVIVVIIRASLSDRRQRGVSIDIEFIFVFGISIRFLRWEFGSSLLRFV